MRRLLTLLRKDLSIFLADPVAIGLGFVVPLVMILVFGFVFGGGDHALRELDVLAVNQDDGPAGRRLLRALDSLSELRLIEKLRGDSLRLDSARSRRRVEQGKSSAALIIPRDFSDGLRHGEVRLTILKDPRDPIVAGVVEGLLMQQAFAVFPGILPVSLAEQQFGPDPLQQRRFDQDLRRIIEKNFEVSMPESLSFGQLFPEEWILGSDPDTTKGDSARARDSTGFNFKAIFDRAFRVKSEAVVGQKIVNPGIAQSVAGPAVMFMLFAVGAIGASLLREMRYGTAMRLLVSGVRPGMLLLSKYLWAVLLGAAQLVVMMIYGRLIFGLDIFAHPLALMVMILCVAAVMSGIGLLLAAISRTEEQATGYQVVVILAMSAIGGAMFPSFMIPKAIRSIAAFTPVHWSMQGFLDIFWRDQSVAGIALECGVLLGMAVFLVTISVLLFRKRLRIELG